jgi:hypothetical protein
MPGFAAFCYRNRPALLVVAALMFLALYLPSSPGSHENLQQDPYIPPIPEIDPPANVSGDEVPWCNCAAVMPNSDTTLVQDLRVRRAVVGSQGKPRRAIAVSLLSYKQWKLMHTMLESLFASDIMDHDVILFVWLNDPRDSSEVTFYLKRLVAPVRVILIADVEGQNRFIVVPRIRLYETIQEFQKRGCGFNYLLEIHDDMIFPQNWFNELLTLEVRPPCTSTPKGCGILMPLIINPSMTPLAASWTVSEIERRATPWASKPGVVLAQCKQIHPWLVNMSTLDEIGYYDSVFAPVEVEDDDLYMRIFQAGFKFAALTSSVVFHAGGATRNNFVIP